MLLLITCRYLEIADRRMTTAVKLVLPPPLVAGSPPVVRSRMGDRLLHRPVLALLQPLIERGQRAGAFRSDVPTAWHLSMLLVIIHAASGELQTNPLPTAEIESALVTTVLGVLGATGAPRR